MYSDEQYYISSDTTSKGCYDSIYGGSVHIEILECGGIDLAGRGADSDSSLSKFDFIYFVFLYILSVVAAL